MEKPFSPSCERNKEPIFAVLKELFNDKKLNILEIGSGTGQHAAYFSPRFPNVKWTCSDKNENLNGINSWTSKIENILPTTRFEIGKDGFPEGLYDVVYTANTFHIMDFEKVKLLIKMLGTNLKNSSMFIVYGPFNYNGNFTSNSNESFDLWLKERDPVSGIRSFEEITDLLNIENFKLIKDYEMPANNRILFFKKN